MLPSMPLISTPLKEPTGDVQRNETSTEFDFKIPMTTGDSESLSSKEIAVCGTAKPVDHHSPPSLRPIAPKPVMVVISAPSPSFTAVSHITPTEILPPAPDVVSQLSTDVDALQQSGDTSVEQSAGQPLELLAQVKKEEPQSSSEASEKKDNEDELAALMLASTTIRSSPKSRSANAAKKKSKHIRDIEATLNLLAPDSADVKNDKAFGFAQAYFIKVTERLEGKNDGLYQEFLKTMNDFGRTFFSVPELYRKITAMLHEHPDLAEEFLAFLLPEQAMECGKFMEHLMITKMRDFFRMLEVYFAKQPQQMRKIYSSLSALSSQKDVTLQDVRTAILPLLKGNSLLVDSFLQLLPQERPPDSIVSEYEEIDCGDADSYHSGDHFETVEVPDQKDMYGGDHCLCECHQTEDDKYKRRALHCVSCGTKFIYGKVFVQTGKVLRPAKVVFDIDKNRTIKRLSAKDRPKKCGRKRSIFQYNKDTTPTKSQSEEGRHESESISPKSSRSNKSRTPALSHKKGNKSTPKDMKTVTSHSARALAGVASSKARIESSPNVLAKKPVCAVKSSASSSLKEVPSLLCSPEESPTASKLEPKTDSQDSEASLGMKDAALLFPECVITESTTPLPLAALDESASMLPPEPAPSEVQMKDFSSLSQVLRPDEPDVSMAEQPHNNSSEEAFETKMEVKDNVYDFSVKAELTETSVSQASCENDLEMEVDSIGEKPPVDVVHNPDESQGSSHDRTVPMSWTREEDKLILQMFQMECNAEQTFQKISQHLSQRSVEEIRERFYTLMNLLQQMTGVKMEQGTAE